MDETPPGGADRRPSTPRAELAAAVRRLITLTATAVLTDEELAGAASAANGLADRLAGAAADGRLPRGPGGTGGTGGLLPPDFFPTSPVFGPDNPIAPPVKVRLVDGELRATATFDEQYEGPPGCVHGGVIALVMDEMLGAANIVSGHMGMTGTLTIRYRKPTPLGRPLTLTARFTHRTGRKLHCEGAIHDGDTLTVEATGLFVEFDPANF